MLVPLILITSTAIASTRADFTFHHPIKDSGVKRDFLTCQETYGGGSMTCGSDASHFCYDPAVKESCCLLDNGYCKEGDFCAPVAGFCCHNGEDPSACAKRLDFTIPGGVPSTILPKFTSLFGAWSSTTSNTTPMPTSMQDGAMQTSTPDPTQNPASTTSIALSLVTPTSDASGINALLTPSLTTGSASTLPTPQSGMNPDFTAPANITNWAPQPGAGNLAGGNMTFTGEGTRSRLDTVFAGVLVMLGSVVVCVHLMA